MCLYMPLAHEDSEAGLIQTRFVFRRGTCIGGTSALLQNQRDAAEGNPQDPRPTRTKGVLQVVARKDPYLPKAEDATAGLTSPLPQR